MLDRLFGLEGEVAVVTGSGRGIGEGIARTLAGAGASVVCAARRRDEIERVANDINESGGRALAVATDVTDEGAVERLAKAAIEEWGKLDIWINNAGGSPLQTPLMELPREEWEATIALNLTAIWSCTRIAVKHMEDGGRVVNISSVAAEMVVPGSGHYSAAKAGTNMLTRTFAQELGPRIRVNCIMPGAVPTEIMMRAMHLEEKDLPGLEKMLRLPAGRLGTPEDLGAAQAGPYVYAATCRKALFTHEAHARRSRYAVERAALVAFAEAHEYPAPTLLGAENARYANAAWESRSDGGKKGTKVKRKHNKERDRKIRESDRPTAVLAEVYHLSKSQIRRIKKSPPQ